MVNLNYHMSCLWQWQEKPTAEVWRCTSEHSKCAWILPGHFARLQWLVVQEPSKHSFCFLQVQANSKYSQNPKTFKTFESVLSCTKNGLKRPVAIRTQIFKTSTEDLISTDPQLLQCIATDDYCIYKEKQILQVEKVRVYWYHMRIYTKMSFIKKPKRYKLRKHEVVS